MFFCYVSGDVSRKPPCCGAASPGFVPTATAFSRGRERPQTGTRGRSAAGLPRPARSSAENGPGLDTGGDCSPVQRAPPTAVFSRAADGQVRVPVPGPPGRAAQSVSAAPALPGPRSSGLRAARLGEERVSERERGVGRAAPVRGPCGGVPCAPDSGQEARPPPCHRACWGPASPCLSVPLCEQPEHCSRRGTG